MIDLRLCQHVNGYLDGRSQIKVHTDERTQIHSAQSSLMVTYPGTNRARRYSTSVTKSLSKHWSPMWTTRKLNLLCILHSTDVCNNLPLAVISIIPAFKQRLKTELSCSLLPNDDALCSLCRGIVALNSRLILFTVERFWEFHEPYVRLANVTCIENLTGRYQNARDMRVHQPVTHSSQQPLTRLLVRVEWRA
jgi:hypothetical protein